MRIASLSLVFLLPWMAAATAWAAGPAQDATSVESVTVNGERAQEAARKLVKSLATPAQVSGHISRWQDGICPLTVGLRASAVGFINDRLRAVAAQVGAPVDQNPNCTVNIEIVFTTTPQTMIDSVHRKRPMLLGYARTDAAYAALAKVSRPVQAWYLTQTRDIYGASMTDMGRRNDATMATLGLPDAIVAETTGSRLGNGLTSAFQHVIVAADPTKLTDYPIGQIADYIALLVLSHVDAPDRCQPLSSIVNLLVPGCANVPDGLSAADTAYLGGLYRRMQPGLTARLQRGQLVSQVLEQGDQNGAP